MGVQLRDIIPRKEIELSDLAGKKIAIDAFNTLYQFITIIRDRETGEPLRDSKGRITSHLSGLFYRTINLMQEGIRPVFVFDGEPPSFKEKTREERREFREEMRKKLEEAKAKGDIETIRIASQASAILTQEMVKQAKELLTYMGIPWVQAPSEGEAQCAFLVARGYVYAAASQDYDSLLFGSPKLIRNLSITGKRKLPRKNEYIEIKPELIELKEVLDTLGITREQLIIIGLLVGTDYNPGISGIGPKKALKIVKEEKTLKHVLKKIDWEAQFEAEPIEAEKIFEFFLEPKVTEKFDLTFKAPQKEKILKFMVDEFEFSQERIEKHLKILEESRAMQKSLASWF
jgi:flap endonuclease-1